MTLSDTLAQLPIRRYLSDPTQDVKVATENLLADFLREVRQVTQLQKRHEAQAKVRREAELQEEARRAETEQEKLPDITMVHSERAMFVPENGVEDGREKEWNGSEQEVDHRDTGSEFSPFCLSVAPLLVS